MEKEFNPSLEIKSFLSDRKDEPYLKRPSIYYLKDYADKLLEIARKWKSQSDTEITPLIRIFRDLDIFKADLPGELQHDYDKDNKRYLGKWRVEKAKLDSIKHRLLAEYEKSHNEQSSV
jgi:hypothetical protein